MQSLYNASLKMCGETDSPAPYRAVVMSEMLSFILAVPCPWLPPHSLWSRSSFPMLLHKVLSHKHWSHLLFPREIKLKHNMIAEYTLSPTKIACNDLQELSLITDFLLVLYIVNCVSQLSANS